jgi:hypothetical protein
VQCWADEDPVRATRFYDCTFNDTAARPRKGKLQIEPGPIVNLDDGRNVLFSRCRFAVAHGWNLPYSSRAVYESCVMRQVGGGQGYPRGVYRGRSTISGNVGLEGARVLGTLVVNGSPYPK